MQAQAIEVVGARGGPGTPAGRKILPGGGATVRENLPHAFDPEFSPIFNSYPLANKAKPSAAIPAATPVPALQ